MRSPLAVVLLVLTWGVSVYHLGTAPQLALNSSLVDPRSKWLPAVSQGINQLLLFGTALERGNFAGQATKNLLYRQESELQTQLKELLPVAIYRYGLFFVAMRWFWGIEKYLESWMTEEMWGVAQSTSHEFNPIAEPFTRQIAYHGLHEVGQTMVDMNPEFAGCTVFGVPFRNSWVIGRNFDFEGGRVFDEEKIVKWVFPNKGYAYVSVIWAGMVGAVTGVNEHGVYLSINAAGTTDFRRIGTPSTLVLTKALQEAKTAIEAKVIIEQATLFITDIFVVADRRSPILYRIEKSPKRSFTIEERGQMVVANHLIAPEWGRDTVNEFRKTKLTSSAREQRGKELLASYQASALSAEIEGKVLSFLRDKNAVGGERLHLGNRAAIDALIATHGVIWNGSMDTLYVSRGPSLTGEFVGFNLKESFKEKNPVMIAGLPGDSDLNSRQCDEIHLKLKFLSLARKRLKAKQLMGAKALLDSSKLEHVDYYELLGDYSKAIGDLKEAEKAWEQALKLHPPYASQRERIEKKLVGENS